MVLCPGQRRGRRRDSILQTEGTAGRKISIDGLALASAGLSNPGASRIRTHWSRSSSIEAQAAAEECIATTGLEVLGPDRGYKIRVSEIVSDCEARYGRLLAELLGEIRDKAEPGFEPPLQGAGSSIKPPPRSRSRAEGMAARIRTAHSSKDRSARSGPRRRRRSRRSSKGPRGSNIATTSRRFPTSPGYPEERRLRVCFLTTLRRGKYLYGRGTEPKRTPGPMSHSSVLWVSPARRRGSTGSCTRSRRGGSMSSHRMAPRPRAGRSNRPVDRSRSSRPARWRRRSRARPAVRSRVALPRVGRVRADRRPRDEDAADQTPSRPRDRAPILDGDVMPRKSSTLLIAPSL